MDGHVVDRTELHISANDNGHWTPGRDVTDEPDNTVRAERKDGPHVRAKASSWKRKQRRFKQAFFMGLNSAKGAPGLTATYPSPLLTLSGQQPYKTILELAGRAPTHTAAGKGIMDSKELPNGKFDKIAMPTENDGEESEEDEKQPTTPKVQWRRTVEEETGCEIEIDEESGASDESAAQSSQYETDTEEQSENGEVSNDGGDLGTDLEMVYDCLAELAPNCGWVSHCELCEAAGGVQASRIERAAAIWEEMGLLMRRGEELLETYWRFQEPCNQTDGVT